LLVKKESHTSFILGDMKIIILIIFMIIGNGEALAISYSSPPSLNFAISLKDQHFFSYGIKSVDNTLAFVEIKDCLSTVNKGQYIMVTFGPEVVDIFDSFRGINYNREYTESSSCSFKNNPLAKINSPLDREKNFQDKWSFINHCIEVNVKELGSHPLVYPKDQEGCVITKMSTMSAKFNGGYCFFKPNSDSRYNVSLSVAKECLNLNAYRDYQIDLQDLSAELSGYTSKTYKGDLEDLTTIGTTAIRISVNPDKSVLAPSEDFGIIRPTFPANYQINDLHLGKISFTSLDDFDVRITTPFIIDNASCKKNVVGGVMSSACDYAMPIIGNVTLKDDQGKEILTWQDGGLVPANWQGILSGIGFKIIKDLIPTNKKYTFEFEFGDPEFSFNIFKNRITRRIGGFTASFPVFMRDGGINEITEIRVLEEIDNMIEIDPIAPLRFSNPMLNLANSRRRLNSYFSSSLFPPMYVKTCNAEGKCIDASRTSVKFIATFKLMPDYSIMDLQITRKSDLLTPYTKTIFEQPEYICE